MSKKHLENNIKAINFFKSWSPASTYAFGLLATDGCVYNPEKRGCGPKVMIAQSKKCGLDLLKNIKDKVGYGSIYSKKSGRTKFGRCRPAHSLVWTGKNIVQAIIDLGITPKKSLILKMPKVPDNVLSHFMRGVLDGDGCIYIDRGLVRSKRFRRVFLFSFIVSASKAFAEGLSNRLTQAIGIAPKINVLRKNDKKWRPIYRVGYSGSNAEKFLEWLYANKESSFWLPRKYEKYQQYLEEKKEYDQKSFHRMVRSGRRWSKEMDGTLTDRIRAGVTLSKIAKEFGKSVQAIKTRYRKKLGLRTNYYWTPEVRTKVVEMLNAGVPCIQIASAVNRPIGSIYMAKYRKWKKAG